MRTLFLFLLGAVAGSFSNVVIHRVPLGRSIVKPGSSCPVCSHPLSALENVPVLSYLGLRGRCRKCGARISARYPIVELTVAALWAVTGVRLGFGPELPAFLVFVCVLVILSAIDLQIRRLPNKIVGTGAVLGAVLLGAAAAWKTDLSLIGSAVLGAVSYGVPMLALALAVPGGMGMGDVKFAAYLGLHLGYLGLTHVAVGAFLGFLIGAVSGLVLMASGKKRRKETIPFGPSMAVGAGIAAWWGGDIIRAWLG